MDQKSRTLRRLGVAGLGASVALGTSVLGFAGSAAAATDGISIISQFTGNASTASDGTNTNIKISANPYGGDASDIARVDFSVQETAPNAGTPDIIASDTTAPYSTTWSPTTAGTYTETVTSYTAQNIVLATDSTSVDVSTTADAVHIAAPSEGSSIGEFTGTGTLVDGGTIAVSGTRSATNPALSVYAESRDNSDGSLSSAGTTTTVAAGTSGNASQQAWSGVVAVPGQSDTSATSDVDIFAAPTSDSSDEVTEAQLYKQTVTTVPAPANQTVLDSASTKFVVNATDQNGNPVAGLTVTAAVASHTGTVATITPATTTTDAAGNATFTASAGASSGSTTFQFRTEINGSTYNAATDFSRTATLTYAPAITQTPTSLAFKVTPSKTIYAGQSEYGTNTPVVDVCVSDQNGNPIANTNGAPSNLIVSDVRTVNGGTPGSATTPTLTADPATGFSNCYTVSHDGNAGEYGTDAFNAYLETNGTPGQQSGEASASTTTKWDNLSITGSNTQGAKGSNVSESFTVLGADGTPFVGRQINLTLTGGTNASFPASGQPSGTTDNAGSTTAATCTTDSSGVCSYVVTEAANTNGNETVQVLASDTITTGNQIATGVNESENVRFEDSAPTLSTVSAGHEAVVAPGTIRSYTVAEPGTIIDQRFTLVDAHGNDLDNTPVTITTDHGFFTAAPENSNGDHDYTYASFSPAIADGGVAGNVAPTSDGTTFKGTTDNSGGIEVSLSIGRDAAFDANGNVKSTLTFSSDSGTATASPDTDQSYTWSTNQSNLGELSDAGVNTPLNPGSVKLVPTDGDTTLSGVTSSDYQDNGPSFSLHLTDQFGNLTEVTDHEAQITASGPADIEGNGDSTTDGGSYTSDPDVYTVENDASSTTKSDATITATWSDNTSVFNASTSGNPPVTTYTVNSSGTSTPSTDSFTVSEYAVDINNLHYAYSVLPAKNVATGTTVHDEVTVTDQYNNPVPGLYVNFDQSGPGDVDNNNNEVRTNGAGTGSDNFSSAVQGDATVTVDVYECDINDDDCSGIPLSESVNTIGFDGVPSIAATSRTGSGKVTVSGKTRPGASVQLLEKASGASTYGKVGSPQTANADGSYTFSPSVTKTTSFEVSVDGVKTSVPATSTVKSAKIVEKPTVTLSSTSKGHLTVKVATKPKLAHKTVHIYAVSASGKRTLLGSLSSGSGTASKTFKLTAGKTYKIEARVLGLGSKYTSDYSAAHSKKVKK